MKEGWKIQTLGDVATFINGDRSTNYPSKKDYVIDGIPFVNAGNLIQSGLDLETLNLISQSKYDSLTQGKFVEGDILFCLRGTLGKHSIVQNGLNGAIASSLVIIRTKDGFNNKYISYFLDYKQPFIERLNNGAAQPNIPAKTMKGFPILLPPNEKQQQSIVEYLDSAFAQIDELKSNAEKQLAEARALFQSALTQAMQPKPGWQEKKLKDIADVKGGKRVPKGYKLQSTKTNHPYIRVADFNNYGTIEMSDIQYISDEIFEQIKNYTITDQDLYVSIAGTIGKTGIIPSELNGANLTENACKLVFKEDINLRFVYLFTLSEIFKKQVEKATKQASQPKLALTRLAEVKMSVPSIIEQQQIVSCLDSLSNHVKELEEISRKAAAECDAMKQALLRQIFE